MRTPLTTPHSAPPAIPVNSLPAIAERVRRGRVGWTGPLVMTFLMTVLAALASLSLRAYFAAPGQPDPGAVTMTWINVWNQPHRCIAWPDLSPAEAPAAPDHCPRHLGFRWDWHLERIVALLESLNCGRRWCTLLYLILYPLPLSRERTSYIVLGKMTE